MKKILGKTIKKVTLGILLASCALPVFAESKWSGELLVGRAEQKSSIDSFDSTTSGGDLSFGIRAALTVNSNIAFELAYQDYGTAKDSTNRITTDVSSSAVNLGVKGIIPFEGGFSVHGRFGLSRWEAEFKAASLSETLTVDDSGSDLYYGLGLQYDISPELVVGVEYAATDMDILTEGTSLDHKVKNLSLSLGYKF